MVRRCIFGKAKSQDNLKYLGDGFMDERPRSREGERKEHPSAFSWFVRNWKISSLLGVKEDEPPRGLRQYWPLAVTLLTIVAVHTTLTNDVRVLPPFMFLILVLLLLVPIFYARRRRLHALARFLGWGLVTFSTAVVASSVFRLVVALGVEQTPSQALLNSGLVWLTNAVTFALWYFEMDSGGPEKSEREGHST